MRIINVKPYLKRLVVRSVWQQKLMLEQGAVFLQPKVVSDSQPVTLQACADRFTFL
jgi:hypothetical protein